MPGLRGEALVALGLHHEALAPQGAGFLDVLALNAEQLLAQQKKDDLEKAINSEMTGNVVDLSEFIGTDAEDAIEALAETRDDESDIIFDDEQPAASEPTA